MGLLLVVRSHAKEIYMLTRIWVMLKDELRVICNLLEMNELKFFGELTRKGF